MPSKHLNEPGPLAERFGKHSINLSVFVGCVRAVTGLHDVDEFVQAQLVPGADDKKKC